VWDNPGTLTKDGLPSNQLPPMSRGRGLLILLGCALLLSTLLAAPAPPESPQVVDRAGDVATYRTIVSRLRSGEPYHAVVGDALRHGYYATREPFNWRTPLLWSSLARMPDSVGRLTLFALGLLVFWRTLAMTARRPLWLAGSNLMQAGALVMLVAPGIVLLGEAWAGMLIGLSVCMYAAWRPRWAVLLGLAALFVRELAAPYCVACAIAAVVNRRWRETGAWLAGACVYGVYYVWHLTNVWAHRLPTDLSHASSWVEFGGIPSLLTMARWHAWLLPSPPWATAFALTIVVAGVCAPRTPAPIRLTGAIYVAFFLLAGKAFNGYWGLVAWPTWALGCGSGLQLVADAVASLRANRRRL
jgi:hypothetical protein